MVAGIRWRRSLPTRASQRWTFVHRADALSDAVVVIDGTDDEHKVVLANDAARAYLDSDGDQQSQALTHITSQYTNARQAPVTLTLARREWRLTDLEVHAAAALDDVLRSESVDLAALATQAQDLRQQLDNLHESLV